MTKDQIMKMDDRELYERLLTFIYSHPPALEVTVSLCLEALRDALYYCYQAEEKVKEMGDSVFEQWGVNLDTILEKEDYGSQSLADIAHAYPKQRVQAILLTLKELEEP